VCFERIGGLKPTLPLLKEMIEEIWGGGKKKELISELGYQGIRISGSRKSGYQGIRRLVDW